MECREIVLATTSVDRHCTKFSKESLDQTAEHLRGRYIPLLNEHDWLQPIGRIVGGSVRQRDDGEWELTGTAEIPGPGDAGLASEPGREFRVSGPDAEGISLRVGDEFLREAKSRATVAELKMLLGKPVGLEGRRALEPPDLVKISLAVAVGHAFSGFFGELGADTYRKLKELILRLFATRPATENNRRLCIDLFFEREGVEVILIQADPTAEGIDGLLSNGLQDLDLMLPGILRDIPDVRRVVGEYGHAGLRIAYVLGRDCLPRAIHRREL